MDRELLIYTLLILAFVVQQMYSWARLIQWRRHVLYPTPVLLWSLFFIGRLLAYSLRFSFFSYAFLLLNLVVGWLLFPRIEGLDYNSKYTYIDAYEELRQNRFWVFGLALLGELLVFYEYCTLFSSPFDFSLLVVPLLLLAALLTQHKGLMLLWVWLGLLWLWWF